MGVKGNMIKFLNSFLTNRFLKVRVGTTLSSSYTQEEGVPQGSVLSVTCFAVAINGILDEVAPPVRGSLFVDDLAIYVTTYDALSACRYLQKAINAVSKWALKNGFRFSESKTVAIRFTRSRREEVIPNLILNGQILPYQDQVKFLGMIFDNKLTWASYIENLKYKVRKSLDILKVVSGFDWGADKKSLLRLYDALCRSKLDYGCQIYSSTCKTRLKDLDVIHNMGLRICSGAFRTSPIESIYVDTHELPLDLRREELGLRYAARIKSSPDSSSYKLLNQTLSVNYKANSKPFQVRLKEQLGNQNILNEKIMPVKYPKIPPWLLPAVECCSSNICKKDSPPQQIRSKFLEHDGKHEKDFKIYTDGSKSNEGVGCAIVTKDYSGLGRLSDSASVFTAELTAIVHALKEVYSNRAKKFVIYTDSKSAIDAINKYNSFNPLVQKAQEWLFRINARFKYVCFCWVPAHVGIKGNELADKEAKAATGNSIIDIPDIPHSDMYKKIKAYVWKKWQERWASPHFANNKYKSIRPNVYSWGSVFHPDRRTEIVLCRLRIGHTHLTHKFLMEGAVAPECAQCGCTLTVEHILVQCQMFAAVRHKYGLAGRTIQSILDDQCDTTNLVKFLKEIDLFFKF